MSGERKLYVAFDACQLGISFKYSDDEDIRYVNKIISHLKQEPVQITC